MCRVYTTHFSHHDVRPRICMEPFEADGDGVYVDPIGLVRCRCGIDLERTTPNFLDFQDIADLLMDPFQNCPDHDCCVVWPSIVLCPWAYQFLADANGNHDNAHHQCPNLFITHEYYPVQAAMASNRETGEVARPNWRAGDISSFPAEMFYSHRINGAEDQIYEHAVTVSKIFETAESIWYGRALITDDLYNMKDKLRILGNEFAALSNDGAYQDSQFYEIEEIIRRGLNRAAGSFEVIQRNGERLARLLAHVRCALEFLDELPGEGGVASSEDGSYQVSRQRLDDAVDDADRYPILAKLSEDWLRTSRLQQEFRHWREVLHVRWAEYTVRDLDRRAGLGRQSRGSNKRSFDEVE